MDRLGYVVQGMKRNCLTKALMMVKANRSMIDIKMSRKDREKIVLNPSVFYSKVRRR